MTIPQAFALALQHHQAGRLAEAEALYRQILAADPRHADALHLLGVLAHQVGRNEVAIDLIRQAIALAPSVPGSHSNLGEACRAAGHMDAAIAAYRQAIALKPNYPEAHNNLAIALVDKGRLDEAIAACHQAIALKPAYPEAHNNLGNALREMGRIPEAIAAYRHAIALKPNFPEAHSNLGAALRDHGQLDAAIAAYGHAIALKPNYPEAHNNLAIALADMGRREEAIAAYRQAIALQPDYAEAHSNLGNALREMGRLEEAIAAYRHAIALKPEFPEVHSNLGTALNNAERIEEALECYQRALELRFDFPEAHSGLGSALKDIGQLDEAIVAYRQAVTLKPDYFEAHSNLINTLHFHPDYNGRAIAKEHRSWTHRHAEPLRHFISPHGNDRDPGRRLRIGYVSPDFREHCQSLFMIPLLSHHNHHHFEIICYASVTRPDGVTRRIQGFADAWRNTVGLSDEQVASRIREDGIDILMDLTMHMANNRGLLFARKPAPIQVCWLAYPGSTGLTTIDYRLSDPYLDPPGMDESIYSEQTVRLPHSFWCYDPLDVRDIAVGTLPAESNGFITFGCLNNFCKINESVVRLWAKVLAAVPASRLLLLAPEGSHRRRTLGLFAQEGITPERIEFVALQPRQKYLELYHRIDIGLDTLPYNGHTTSLDSLWMGVPVVTLVGQTIVGRAGLSQLMNLQLPELIARLPEEFVQIAAGLARDLPRLTHLRGSLRSRMQASPLMDAAGFAQDIETAYRQMWHQWCAQGRPSENGENSGTPMASSGDQHGATV